MLLRIRGATQGGDTITEASLESVWRFASATINASKSTIQLEQGTSTVNGDGNQLNFYNNGMADYGGQVQLNLSGDNNTISYGANSVSGKQVLIQDSDGDYVQEDASGAISFSTARFSISNGLVTLAFADGNTVKISGVLSSTQDGTLTANNQVNQLVSAMASYSAGSGGASSTFTTQAPTESALFASAHH